MKCSNCSAALSCGCQLKKASDGTQCCTNCVATYERTINKNGVKDDQTLNMEQILALKKKTS